MKRYAVITTVYDPTCYSRENWMADQLWFVGYSKEECLDFVSQKGYNRFLSMDGHQSPCIAEIDPTDIPKSMKSMKDREVYPLCPGNIYDDERDFFYCGEVDNINASYNRDIREWVIDGEKPLEPKKPHKYFKRSNEMKIKENSKITLTVGQLKGLIREGRFLNKVKGLDVEDNKLRSQILKDLKTIVDAEEDLSDAQSILNEMPKVDEISWELGENSGPGILYDRSVCKYLDLYGASITISEGEFDIYYQFSGVPGFGFGTVHFPGIVSFADAIMESKIVEYKALAFTDEDKEIIANAIHKMAMGIPAMLNKVEQLYKNTKINENSKITLTIGQLRRLVKEATALNEAPDQEPLDRMEGDILRLGPCNHQKALCWNLQGFCFTPVKVNPSFSKRMPYMVMCKQDDIWQMHFENFDNFDSKPYLDALYKAFAKTCEEQGIKEINAVGGCTPGGISGISALERYGFHKEYLPIPKTLKAGADGDKTNIYWGGATIDPAKADKWLNGGKHLQEFLVVGNPEKRYKHPEECPLSEPTGKEKYTLNNTNPRPFMMVR